MSLVTSAVSAATQATRPPIRPELLPDEPERTATSPDRIGPVAEATLTRSAIPPVTSAPDVLAAPPPRDGGEGRHDPADPSAIPDTETSRRRIEEQKLLARIPVPPDLFPALLAEADAVLAGTRQAGRSPAEDGDAPAR
jgi:hypothetical protein